MKNKIIILISLLVFIMSITVYAKTDEPSPWAEDSINELKSYHTFKSTTFSNYQKNITRAEFIYFAVRVYEMFSGEDIKPDPSISFIDTSDIYALKGATVGITSGIGNNQFGPDMLLTREQFAVLMVNTLKLGNLEMYTPNNYQFVDENEFSSWAFDAIYTAKANDIISGVGQDKFKPRDNATIEMAITITNKILKNNNNKLWTTDKTSKIINLSPFNINEVITDLSGSTVIDNNSISYQAYGVDLNNDKISVKTAISNEGVGTVDTLNNLAEENHALLAINGTYFSAYQDDNYAKDPYGILVMDGETLHTGSDRAVIGFKNGQVDIDRIDTQIKGTTTGPLGSLEWYGYWINHSIPNDSLSFTIFNDYKQETNSLYGKNYIIEDNTITDIVENESVVIPKDGYVVNLNGLLGSTPEQVYELFEVGNSFDFDITYTPENNQHSFWKDIDYATGAGPALILDGKIDIDYETEHFTEPKIYLNAAARSAIGYTSDNQLIFVTTTSTLDELAQLMLSLNCVEAMNLDGGASSGLWYDGNLIRTPGRDISNIIYIQVKN
ncbi:MAG: phosphodiester glycosidase family protein [Clostridiales bacterium]|nr:phosphodiester glycosidase family protein [Clostridiales bacterium]